MRHRNNFDFTAQCGVWVCTDCDRPFYPMELDNEESPDSCPECLGACRLANAEELPLTWQAGSGRDLYLTLTATQARNCSHSGDCGDDVEATLSLREIKEQVAEWKPDVLAAELKEYGAWEDDELADHQANCERMLWIAAGDMAEQLRDEAEFQS